MITIPRDYVFGSMQLLIALAGTIGNVLVILVILSKRSLLGNIHYYLVLHLAICDFFSLALSPLLIYNAFTGRSMINSPALCKFWWPTHTVFHNAGVFFVVLISIVRFEAVFEAIGTSRESMESESTGFVRLCICYNLYVALCSGFAI